MFAVENGPSAEDLARMAECYAALARLSAERGDPEAAKHFDNALRSYEVLSDHGQMNPDGVWRWPVAWQAQANWLVDEGSYSEAQAALGRAEILLPTQQAKDLTLAASSSSERLHAHILLAKGRLALAEQNPMLSRYHSQALDKLRSLAAKEVASHSHGLGRYPLAMQDLVDCCLDCDSSNAKLLKEATNAIEKMVVLYPPCPSASTWLQRKAIVAWLNGKAEEALEWAQKASNQSPQDELTKVLLLFLTDMQTSGELRPETQQSLSDWVRQKPGNRRLKFWSEKLLQRTVVDDRDESE